MFLKYKVVTLFRGQESASRCLGVMFLSYKAVLLVLFSRQISSFIKKTMIYMYRITLHDIILLLSPL